MADRLISADILRAARYHDLPYAHIHALGVDADSYERGWNDALDAAADSAPTVDAVEVVRCKDCCRSSVKYWTRDGLQKTDDRHLFCKMLHHLMRLDDFCSWGERKEDASKTD